jgi:hypothetical protein
MIEVDLREIAWGGMGWIVLAQDRDPRRALLNTVMNLRVPSIFYKFLNRPVSGGFSRKAQVDGVS